MSIEKSILYFRELLPHHQIRRLTEQGMMNELNDKLIEQMAAEALDVASVAADPITQFRRWYAQARSAGIPREDAMTLATVGLDGAPAARIVLYKDLADLGYAEADFPFFTNYNSDKGEQLEHDARAALVFHWKPPARQVRAEGVVTKLPADISDAYFATRPRGSQLGAWASPQSRVVPSREYLEENERALETNYAGREVPRPPKWGGYVLKPHCVEFWQHRDSRLHDRVRYTREASGEWRVERLGP